MAVRALVAVLAGLALIGCGGGNDERETAATGGLRDVSGVLDLRAAFNADEGRTRILLLLAPT